MRPSATANLGLVLILVTTSASSAEPQTTRQEEAEAVFKATVSLVQVDAVVKDRQGHSVTDLGADDFEVFEDGAQRKISSCTYIQVARTGTATPPPAPPVEEAAKAAPVARERVRRTIAFVVDDLSLDMQSMPAVQDALRTFMDRQMQPGDLVSILRTGAGSGRFQQFTSDKRVLAGALAGIRPNAVGINATGPDPLDLSQGPRVDGRSPRGGRDSGNADTTFEREQRNLLVSGTIAALRFVLTGLRDLPGRKSLVLFSNGISLLTFDYFSANTGPDIHPSPLAEALKGLVDLAAQASVVIYTVDARGVRTGQADASSNAGGESGQAYAALLAAINSNDFYHGQDGLEALAEPTGGLFVTGLNDVSQLVGRVLDDQVGYYLIGYTPASDAFRNRAFHKIVIKARKKGLVVRSRSGYLGVPEGDPQRERERGAGALFNALVSPFDSSGLGLKLRSLFFHDSAKGSLVRSFLHLDAKDLTFADGENSLVAQVEGRGVAVDSQGRVVHELHTSKEPISLSKEAYERALQEGLNYIIDVPVKKAGGYQVRLALRDASSGRVGSAYEYVEVPDASRHDLCLSGILLRFSTAGGDTDLLHPGSTGLEASLVEAAESDVAESETIRVFGVGFLSYGLSIYNAKIDKAAGFDVSARMNLYRDGQLVVAGEPRRPEIEKEDAKTLFVGGTLVLPAQMPEGDYLLQVAVEDSPSLKKRTAVQTIDFSVAR